MKIKTTIQTILLLALSVTIFEACVENDETGALSTTVQPEDLPGSFSGYPDFKYPEKESVIEGWLSSADTTKITKHAWGLWKGLTSKSNQIYNGDALLIYETWLGAAGLANSCAERDKEAGCTAGKTTREGLEYPSQHGHTFGLTEDQLVDRDPNLYVTVSYNPAAACYATNNLIFNTSAVTSKINSSGGVGNIDPFPRKAVTIKPTYYLGKSTDEYVRIPAWVGPPEKLDTVYPMSSWHSYVYVDVSNSQEAGKVVVPTNVSEGTPPAGSIVNLNEFINYKLDDDAAEYMNEQQVQDTLNTSKPQTKVEAGDLAILVAMHVGTKEISDWTWQTFFWTATPSSPPFPSSAWAAALKPTELEGAAGNYALSTAYSMVWPHQPKTGGKNEGVTPAIGYNPYLEAGLNGPFGNDNKLDQNYQFGLQSNCKSCHIFATSNKANGFLSYSADQYVDINDSIFNGWVKLDHAWSVHHYVNEDK